MRWLQDNALALSLSKVSAILVGHDMGRWSPCYHSHRSPIREDFKVPLFVAVITQPGFCDDIGAAWLARQSDVLLEPIRRDCRGQGEAFLACFSAPEVADILDLGGDILACCSFWAQPFSN